MKKYMKKIIVGIFGLAMLFGAQHASASVTWNQASNDCKSISILNATTNIGYANPCWPLSTVQAKAGDGINVRIYYHNTGHETAKNVRIMVGAPADTSSTTKSFTGRIVSDNGSSSFGPVTANISSAQTLTFLSAKWYTKNTSELLTPLYAGQSGSEVLTDNGLEIGSVLPGWADQGSVVVAFKVSSNASTQTCQDPNATNYGGSLPCTYPNTSICTILNFTANGSSYVTVPSGSPVTLVWSTQNCTSSIVSGPNMTSDYRLSGSKTIYPTYSGDYMINAYGDNGTPSRTISVSVNNNSQTCQDPDAMNYGGSLPCSYYTESNCYINNFTVDGSSNAYIDEGESVSLSWDTNNCTYVTVTGPNGFYNTSHSNTKTIYPTDSGTYTLTARGSNGITRTRTVYVSVDNNNNNYDNCYINNFTANGYTNITINQGQQVALAWNTTGCNQVSIGGVGSNLPASYSQFVYPTYSTTYTLNAYGYNSGTRSQTVRVNVNQVVQPVPVYNVCAVTTVATNVTTTSAQLNGLVTNPNGSSANSYFEYGPTVNLGLRTQGRVTNGSFSEMITGLSSGTSYFFRAVSDCNNGLSYGKIEAFSTNSNQVVRPIIVQGTTVVGTASPIMLSIENRYQAIGIGDKVDYTLTYKNIGKSILSDPVLQVVVPKGITITNASAGTYSSETNTLTVPLNDLKPGQDGVVYLQGHVDSIPDGTAQIVTTAILVYTSPNGAQENAIAYVLNSPRGLVVASGNVLGASAFWAGLWNMGLIGWLLLIILILLIILLTRKYSNKSITHTVTPSGNTHTTTTHY